MYFLSIQSSYPRNTEIPASPTAFDTIQFYASGESAWRVKTFAQDEDVHVWSIGAGAGDLVDLARENTAQHYGDVMVKEYLIETDDGIEGVRRELVNLGLADHLEFPRSGAVFWTPAGSSYRTKSSPEHNNPPAGQE
jgi:hypothetical protein